jgi:hypothetical protein
LIRPSAKVFNANRAHGKDLLDLDRACLFPATTKNVRVTESSHRRGSKQQMSKVPLVSGKCLKTGHLIHLCFLFWHPVCFQLQEIRLDGT